MNCLACPLKIVLPGLALVLLGVAAVPALLAPQAAPKSAPPAHGKSAAPAAAAGADMKAGSYDIDSVHSNVIFRVMHQNVSPFYGRFDKVTGTFTLDPAKPEAGKLDVKIDVASLDTNNDKRNQDLLGPDFFSVKEFPQIEFTSDKIKKVKDKVYEAAGKLTMHGVTKDVTLQVEQTGAGQGMGGSTVAGFDATFTIKRSDFGMSNMLEMLGDEVRVMVGIEARLQQ